MTLMLAGEAELIARLELNEELIGEENWCLKKKGFCISSKIGCMIFEVNFQTNFRA